MQAVQQKRKGCELAGHHSHVGLRHLHQESCKFTLFSNYDDSHELRVYRQMVWRKNSDLITATGVMMVTSSPNMTTST